jgi:hypothetical protein
MKRGWWRRNVWGLVLVLPLFVGVFAVNADVAYERNYSQQAKEPVPVDGTGAAVLDEYTVRVVEVDPVENEVEVDDLLGFGDDTLPDGVKIWRAVLAIDAPRGGDNDFVSLCDAWLEDAAGHQYGKNPSELRGAPHLFGPCSADDDDEPAPFTTTLVFLLPAETRPTALVLTWIDQLPRYVRLPVAAA